MDLRELRLEVGAVGLCTLGAEIARRGDEVLVANRAGLLLERGGVLARLCGALGALVGVPERRHFVVEGLHGRGEVSVIVLCLLVLGRCGRCVMVAGKKNEREQGGQRDNCGLHRRAPYTRTKRLATDPMGVSC